MCSWKEIWKIRKLNYTNSAHQKNTTAYVLVSFPSNFFSYKLIFLSIVFTIGLH